MTLDECLAGLLKTLDEDHRRVAAALRGVPGAAPRDPDLKALFHSILGTPAPCTLLDVAVDHPEAALSHTAWAASVTDPSGAGTEWYLDPTTVPLGLPLAS